jgi:hypothetical protein
VRHAKKKSFEHLLTGDESWFYDEFPHDSAWDPSRATLAIRKTQKIQTKRCLVSIVESIPGIHNLLVLPARMPYDAESFSPAVLPDIERNLCDGKRRKTLRAVYPHLENAPAHNTK